MLAIDIIHIFWRRRQCNNFLALCFHSTIRKTVVYAFRLAIKVSLTMVRRVRVPG
jgi:hypothetical protein